MKHLIIYAHPSQESFNHAILETAAGYLKEVEETINSLLHS
ncbi:MAG: hypothetical protein E7L01_08630 [Paenibacillus macerans]|nr:hypothetical protein [Paenibacillus macerans]MDU7473409.1 hypothetical protein [Paenibacillus macerans]